MNKYEKALKRYCAFERTTDEQETVEEQKRYDLLQELVERATNNNYVVTEYCKTKLVETTIASNLSKKDAHRLRELLNVYANKENKVRYKCYDWSE